MVLDPARAGIGQQHLWNEQYGLLEKTAPLGVLLALTAGSTLPCRCRTGRRAPTGC